jgi:hypothetical protein
LADAYRHIPALLQTKFATDQPQFYTLVTTLLSTDLVEKYEHRDLEKRIFEASKIIEGTAPAPRRMNKSIEEYRVAATKQTTHPARREKRHEVLVRLLDAVEV